MAYVYHGTNHEIEPEPEHIKGTPGPPPEGFNSDKCGTMPGYKQHLKHKIDACRPCRDAKAAKSAKEYATHRATRGITVTVFNPAMCGTNKGHRRHQLHGVPACAPCLKAHAEYIKDYRAKKATA